MRGHERSTSSAKILARPEMAEANEVTRRELLCAGLTGLGVLALAPVRSRAEEYSLPGETREALETSGFVYISPLRSDGAESRCHGEVWFAFDRGSVLIATAADTWKNRALGAGLDRARIWVGDFGPVSRAGDRYRSAPGFLARSVGGKDDPAFERLLATFARKYPSEWGHWESRFRRSYADNSRVLIRYEPIGA